MSLLTLINRVQRRAGLAVTSNVIANASPTVQQLRELANLEGEALANDHPWSVLRKIESHSALAAESQGTLDSIAADINMKWGVAPKTMWNQTTDRYIHGPLSAEEWAQLKGWNVGNSCDYYRIYGSGSSNASELHITPAPAESDVISFEYQSKNWCEASGGTDQDAWAADTDTGILDEDIMALGVYWRWRSEQGLDYAQAFDDYQVRVEQWKNRDGGKSSLFMSAPSRSGVLVSDSLTRSF